MNTKKLEEIHVPQTLFEAICSKNKQTQNNKVRKANLTINTPTARDHLNVSKNPKIALFPT